MGICCVLFDAPLGGERSLTRSFKDKAVQIISGTIRVYSHGPNTMGMRTRIVQDYLNTVPLSSAPGLTTFLAP